MGLVMLRRGGGARCLVVSPACRSGLGGRRRRRGTGTCLWARSGMWSARGTSSRAWRTYGDDRGLVTRLCSARTAEQQPLAGGWVCICTGDDTGAGGWARASV